MAVEVELILLFTGEETAKVPTEDEIEDLLGCSVVRYEVEEDA